MDGRVLAALRHICVACVCLACAAASIARAQRNADDVVATVGDDPITHERVEFLVREALGEQELDVAARERLYGEAVQQLIDRCLVMQALAEADLAAGPSEVQLELERLREELARVGQTLDDHWQRIGAGEASWRATVAWRISWQRYLERALTDEALEAYFLQHRRDFDGTEMRVAQILFKVSDADGARQQALELAGQVRAEILAGRLSWEDAVEQHSSAPSRAQQGDLGWIEREQPMPETFNTAAFQLQPGELCQPFASNFGVHLIRCLEVKPGKFLLNDVRDRVRQAASKSRFRELADQRRATTRITIQAATRDR